MSSDRLPSFKGPRDLSLSARGANRDAAQARPRRVFTPNIPPKRDRATASNTPSTSAAPPTESNAPGSSRGRHQRGRGGQRGGSRPPKPRPELVQSESIFSEGMGDAMEARRNSAMQYKGGYGSSRYKSATEGGSSRMSSMNRTTLNTLIKEEDGESNKKIFGTERFEQEEENVASSENPYTPVVLPLIGYVPELFMEPVSLGAIDPSTIVKKEEPVVPTPTTSKDLPTPSLSLVKIKEEKVDDDDEIPTIAKIKQEKLDDTTEKDLEKEMNALAALSLDATSFAGTYRNIPADGTLVYFQFPDELPVLEGSIRESVDQQVDPTKNLNDLVQDINDLPEGFVGRLQILSSGRTRFVIGDNIFDVDPGRPVGFRQELVSVDTENKAITNLGPVNRKFLITPEIDSLIVDAL